MEGEKRKKNYSSNFAWANSTELMGSLRVETGEEEALIPMCGTETSPFQGWCSLLGEESRNIGLYYVGKPHVPELTERAFLHFRS